jgi:hypothetical protein
VPDAVADTGAAVSVAGTNSIVSLVPDITSIRKLTMSCPFDSACWSVAESGTGTEKTGEVIVSVPSTAASIFIVEPTAAALSGI